MLNIDRALSNSRVCRSLTGQSPEEFEALLLCFESTYLSLAVARPRERKFGGGRKGRLHDLRQKLFFLLFYLKIYPTFDLAGFLWEVHRTRPHKWVQKLLPVLEATLGHACVLPTRKISSVSEFLEHFPDVKDVMIDGTERPLARPVSPKHRKKQYSGKQGSHTRKNIVMCDENKKILTLSPTKHGRVHDKKLADKFLVFHSLPSEVTAWADKGFQGAEKTHENTFIPHKKRKKAPLTSKQKEDNSCISSIRIVVENALCGIKRFNTLKHPYRNRLTQGWDDSFILIAAGLWNFHLQQTP